ncbi:uncharacterized protein LOC127862278 isoform X2 [Dreissena polymorpha]|uniref:F-box domain-containing protein n=1 Tax=Dreissena polymorpha TaxID=45954 RepID=A0A9D4BHH1_DREPO|nr:uncharacterized protein LOC127862278 isoform X2 [Dreissena polymorpha]KAH3695740.1 hypothetical protein DPMN_083198 [Dreissena polymorpha]
MDLSDSEEEESEISLMEGLPFDILLEIFKNVAWRDLLHLSATCTRFREICKTQALWLNMTSLHFEGPMSKVNILKLLEKTPHAEHISLVDTDDVYDDDEEVAMTEVEDMDYLKPADRFLLDVLKICSQLKSLDLKLGLITDRALAAVSAKCSGLQSLSLKYNACITEEGIETLISTCSTLTNLTLSNCHCVNNPLQSHLIKNRKCGLKKLVIDCIDGQDLKIEAILHSCPELSFLKLTSSMYTTRVPGDFPPQGANTSMDHMKELHILSCMNLIEVSLSFCPHLEVLDVSYCLNLQSVSGNCPALKIFTSQRVDSLKEVSLSSSSLVSVDLSFKVHLESVEIGSLVVRDLDFSECWSLLTSGFKDSRDKWRTVHTLNIAGCRQMNPSDVCALLAELPYLQKLCYGGNSWNMVNLVSENLTSFEFQNSPKTSFLKLTMPKLKELMLRECLDISEQNFFDHLMYGRQISRLQGLETLVECKFGEPFSNGIGVPDLEVLRCHVLKGFHGDVMSRCLQHFSHLQVLDLQRCAFLKQFRLDFWKAIKTVTFNHCGKLKSLEVQNVPSLTSLNIEYCGMVRQCFISASGLEHLNVEGTNFAKMSVTSSKLQKLKLQGVCTLDGPENPLTLCCAGLVELSIEKCDCLSDQVMESILQGCPCLASLRLVGSKALRRLRLPSNIEECSLTGHLHLSTLDLPSVNRLRQVALNNLPKFQQCSRAQLLISCETNLERLELRTIPQETQLCVRLAELSSLTICMGIHLESLEISCPQLKFLRIQGCPKLTSLCLHLSRLSQIQVYHSMPLLHLRSLTLHCPRVRHVGRLLRHYCPNLEVLSLYGSTIQQSEFHKLGEHLPTLQTLQLNDCKVTAGDQYDGTQKLSFSVVNM